MDNCRFYGLRSGMGGGVKLGVPAPGPVAEGALLLPVPGGAAVLPVRPPSGVSNAVGGSTVTSSMVWRPPDVCTGVGATSATLGISCRRRSSSVGPVLAAAAVVSVLAGSGWFTDSVPRKKLTAKPTPTPQTKHIPRIRLRGLWYSIGRIRVASDMWAVIPGINHAGGNTDSPFRAKK